MSYMYPSGDGNAPLARYVKLRVAHAPGMPRTLSPPLPVSDPDMHHGMCVRHVPWCMPGSLTSGFLWSQCWGKRSRHSRRMRNPQFYISGNRPIAEITYDSLTCLASNDTTVWSNSIYFYETPCQHRISTIARGPMEILAFLGLVSFNASDSLYIWLASLPITANTRFSSNHPLTTPWGL